MKLGFITDTIIIRPSEKQPLLDIRELWRFREFFFVLLLRDIKVRYKQTYIGILWIILQPISSMIIYTAIFGGYAKSMIYESLPYPLFALIGIVFWGYFSSSISYTTTCLSNNANLIKKIYVPKDLFVLLAVMTAFIDFFVALIILLIALYISHIPMSMPFFISLLSGVGVLTLANLGIGFFLSSCSIRYRDVRYIIPFFLQILFFTAPIIYSFEQVDIQYRFLLFINPVTGVIEMIRSMLIYGTIMHLDSMIYSLIFSILIILIGIAYFRKTEQYMTDIL